MALYVSRKAKLRAWVGKYRMTLAVLPLHRATTPSAAVVRRKQSAIPLYLERVNCAICKNAEVVNVLAVETAGLQHLILVLDKKLDTLNGSGSSLGDSSRDTSHYYSTLLAGLGVNWQEAENEELRCANPSIDEMDSTVSHGCGERRTQEIDHEWLKRCVSNLRPR